MEHGSQNPARLIAPVALAVCAVAFFGVILSSGGSDDGETREPAAQRERTAPREKTSRKQAARGVYTVKTGDTLGTISEKTGVSVERLQELNPQLDPQALVSGQKIKLRE